MRRSEPNVGQSESRMNANQIAEMLVREHGDMAGVVARDVLAALEERRATMERRHACERARSIACAVARRYELRLSDMLGRSGVERTVRVRRLAWAVAHHRLECSYTSIAEAFGRTYDSVAQGIRIVSRTDEYRALVQALEKADAAE